MANLRVNANDGLHSKNGRNEELSK